MKWYLKLFMIFIYINSIYPIYVKEERSGGGYMIMLLILLAQICYIAPIWRNKRKWSELIVAEHTDLALDIDDLENHIVCIFLHFEWFIFCCIIPYSFYIGGSMEATQIFTAFIMSLLLWVEINRTTFRQTMFGLGMEQNIFVAIPYMTIAVFIAALTKTSHMEGIQQATELTLKLVMLYTVETLLGLAIRFIVNKKKVNKR